MGKNFGSFRPIWIRRPLFPARYRLRSPCFNHPVMALRARILIFTIRIEQRARHEGPTPEDGTWQFTDTIPSTLGGGSFEFAFVAEDAGAITSDSLRLWINAKDIRPWVIDSIQANSWSEEQIGVLWSRPAIDSGADTIFVQTSTGTP